MKKTVLTLALLFSAIISNAQAPISFTPFLANSSGETITVASIMAEPKVGASPTPSTVSGFKISFLTARNNFFGPYTVQGNMLTQQVLDVIRNLKAGDKLCIEELKVKSVKEYRSSIVVYVIK